MVAQVFISCASEDRQLALSLHGELRRHGIDGWVASEDIQAGEHWPSSLAKAIAESDLLVVLVTERAMLSCHVEREVSQAVDHRIPLLWIKVANARLMGALSYLLQTVQQLALPDPFAPEAAFLVCSQVQKMLEGVPPPVRRSASHWNPPFPRNTRFVGRDDLLDRLRATLASRRPTALVQPQALVGLGGIGKSQTALEYAYRHLHEYGLVWWVRAEREATLVDDLLALAGRLELTFSGESDPSGALRRLRAALDDRNDYLLVFDNAPDPTSITPHLPARQQGHVLVTSRNVAWGEIGQAISVPILPRQHSLQLLRERSGRKDDPAAENVARRLGDLPLALVQAAAYVQQCGCDFAEYIRLFDEDAPRILESGPVPLGYDATVAGTWALSFRQLGACRPTAARLLDLCAIFDPDAIPIEIFRQLGADDLELNQDLTLLARYSLLDRSGDLLSVHRLEQLVIRKDLRSRAALAEIVLEAVRLLDRCCAPHCALRRVATFRPLLLPHIVRAAEHARTEGVVSEGTSQILLAAGQFQAGRGLPTEARPLLEGALAMARAYCGSDDHELVAESLLALARVLEMQSEFIDACGLQIRAIESLTRIFGSEVHRMVALAFVDLGVTHWRRGHLPEAQAALEKAISLAERLPISESCEVLTMAFHDLGTVFLDQNRFDEAEEKLNLSLERQRSQVDGDRRALAVTLHELGRVSLARAEASRAPRMDNANEVFQARVGFSPEHLALARSRLEEALAMHEGLGAPEHPDLLFTMHVLGRVRRGQGDVEGARQLFERTIQCRARVHGDVPHFALAESMYELALIEGMDRNFVRAAAMLEEVLHIEEQVYGTRDHHSVAVTEGILAAALLELGRTGEARQFLEHAVATCERALGPMHPRTQRLARRLAALAG